MSNALQQYLRDESITPQRSVPECPQKDGIAGPRNHYLLDVVRCMIKDAYLSHIFWGEAALKAT